MSQQSGRFFQIFVVFSEYLNFATLCFHVIFHALPFFVARKNMRKYIVKSKGTLHKKWNATSTFFDRIVWLAPICR